MQLKWIYFVLMASSFAQPIPYEQISVFIQNNLPEGLPYRNEISLGIDAARFVHANWDEINLVRDPLDDNPISESLLEAMNTHRWKLGFSMFEYAATYVLMNQAKISRKLLIRKREQLNEIVGEFMQDHHVSRCRRNLKRCDMKSVQKARNKFRKGIENILQDLEEYSDWNKFVTIPTGALIATAGIGSFAFMNSLAYPFWPGCGWFTAVSAVGVGGVTLAYATYDYYVTYIEVHQFIRKMRAIRASQAKMERDLNILRGER